MIFAFTNEGGIFAHGETIIQLQEMINHKLKGLAPIYARAMRHALKTAPGSQQLAEAYRKERLDDQITWRLDANGILQLVDTVTIVYPPAHRRLPGFRAPFKRAS